MTKELAHGSATEGLEVIDGIGPVTADALARLGVSTTKALALASPGYLAAELRTVGQRASLRAVEVWIAEARGRTGASAKASPAPDDEGRCLHPPGELLAGWIAGPGFTVWFLTASGQGEVDVASRARRTIVYSEKGPGPMKLFDGTDEWVGWIRDEAGL
jgi:hypothetical protein